MQNPIPLCGFEAPKYFFLSDQVPSLVYYSHIPLILVSLSIALLIFFKSRSALSNKVLLFTLIAFSSWVTMSLLFWANNRSDIVMLVWRLTLLVEPLIYIGSLYFIKVIVDEKDTSFNEKLFMGLLYLPVILFLPTQYSLSGFDIATCLSIEGPLALYYIYIIEAIYTLWAVFYSTKRYRQEQNRKIKKEIAYLGFGIFLFLLAFSWGNLIGSFTDNWKLGEFGLAGMPIFMGFLGYSIVKFKLFNLKLIGANVLVVALWVLTGSLLLIQDISISHAVVGVTLIMTIVFGLFLIQSVRNEVDQREKIEKLALELQTANERLQELDQLKSEFLSFASHQLRNPLTAVKGYASMVLEGDYGKVKPEITKVFETIYNSTVSLLLMVQDFLDVTKISQGGMKYEMKKFDLKKFLNDLVMQEKPVIDEKGLTFELNILDEKATYNILGDANKLKQVFLNVIDNSIKYTLKGNLELILEKQPSKYIISVKDTGVGISKEDIAKLFAKFSRATGAQKINVTGSGLGLYLAKQIVEAHKGNVRVESPGVGLGSTFTIELPTP